LQAKSIYDFTSEIYFVGRSFDNLIRENGIKDFKYSTLLANMCAASADHRPPSFQSIETEVQSGRFSELEFDEDDIAAYRQFASDVFACMAKIEVGATYVTDPARVLSSLTDAFRTVSMEHAVPDASKVLGCFVTGGYHFIRRRPLIVENIRLFLDLLNRSSAERRRVILANLYSKLDAVDRYSNTPFDDNDIPF
jgi:serine/threonine-protein kinase